MLQIKKTNEKDKSFFKEMGYYFSRKEIIKEMDCQLYSNENMDWYLLYKEDFLVGFVSAEEKKDYFYIDNFYIIKEERGLGLGCYLFEYIFKKLIFEGKKIKLITRNECAQNIFKKFGFKEAAKNGRYSKMEI